MLTLSVHPSCLILGVYSVKAAHDAGLNFRVNLMAMDYGPALARTSMFHHAVDAAKNTDKFLRSLSRFVKLLEAQSLKFVELTLIIGINDVICLVHTFEDNEKLAQCCLAKGVDLSYWSLTRDHPAAGQAGGVSLSYTGIAGHSNFAFGKQISSLINS